MSVNTISLTIFKNVLTTNLKQTERNHLKNVNLFEKYPQNKLKLYLLTIIRCHVVVPSNLFGYLDTFLDNI